MAREMFRTPDIESVNEFWDAALKSLKACVEAAGQENLLLALTIEGKLAGEGLQTMDEDDDAVGNGPRVGGEE